MYKFKPILKSTLWGGDRIIPFKAIPIDADHDVDINQIGESWELSGVEGYQTVVADGPMAGKSLNELVALLGDRLVGHDNYVRHGNEFPLLVKFIDARQDLSIQVHPNDEMARQKGKEHGKTEMWYIMDSQPDAKIYCGLRQQITPEDYNRMVADDTICDALTQYTVSEGDVFYLPAGRIHSICTGCFLTEIQQTSDITYRIYDFKRRDKDGNYRQLHTKEAAECIDYHVQDDYRTHYTPQKNHRVQLVSCPHFTTAVYDLDQPTTLDYSRLDSFVILIGMKGEATVTDDTGQQTTLRGGETLLIPATTRWLQVSGTLKFLESYV